MFMLPGVVFATKCFCQLEVCTKNSVLTNVFYFVRQPRMYKIAVAFMLAWPYGLPRVMSSYNWPEYIENGKDVNDWVGPPSDSNYNTKTVTRNSDLSCGDGWICEHR